MIAELAAEKLGTRNAGLAFLGVAAACAIAALLLAWSAVQRWRTVAALQAWNQATLSNHADEARDAAARANDLRPDSAAAALAATDLTRPDAADRLAVVAVRCARRDRETVEEGAALAQALRGKAVGAGEGVDAALLAVVATLAKDDGGTATWPRGDGAPDGAIARAAAERLARAAWRRGDAAAIRESFGRLALLAPNRADARRLVCVCSALDPAEPRDHVALQLSRVGDSAAVATLLRACARLAPERAAALDPLMPSDQRSPDEARAALLRSAEPVASLAVKAEAQNDPVVTESIAWRCLAAGSFDLADRLTARLPDEAKKRLAIASATMRGDVSALAALQPDRDDLKPRISELYSPHNKTVAFHLATRSGLVPAATPTIVMGGVPVPSTGIRRWDSLMLVARTADIEEACEIRVGDALVWSGRVSP